MEEKILWTNANIDILEGEPIGTITNRSFFLDKNKIVVYYKDSETYSNTYKENIEDLSCWEGKGARGFFINRNEWHDDLLEKLQIYIDFVDSLSAKLVELDGIKQLYLSLERNLYPHQSETFAEITTLYNCFLRHLNLTIKNVEYPTTNYYRREREKMIEENRLNREQNQFLKSWAEGTNLAIEKGASGTFYNDELDLDQQSDEYWDH